MTKFGGLEFVRGAGEPGWIARGDVTSLQIASYD